MCNTIPQENKLRQRVMQEDSNAENRGTRGTCVGRKLSYLFVLELVAHSQKVAKKDQDESMHYWAQKARVAQLQMTMPHGGVTIGILETTRD